MSLKNTYKQKLKNLLKAEIARMYLTSDGKKFFDENEAIMHESTLDKLRIKERRWDKMKTKIAVLGSTGSIGQSLLKIISKDKQKFKIILLTADKNFKIVTLTENRIIKNKINFSRNSPKT